MGKEDWQEAFTLIDESGSGVIPTTKFGHAIRASGGYPTEDDLKKMIEAADPGDEGVISLDAFLKQRAWIEKANPADVGGICESFKVFDKDGEGKINKTELMHILTSMGDKLTAEEAEQFINEADIEKGGMIDFKRFLEQIME
mmetsp:Transcript_131529/g.196006  ORF Transcript_131529/g.196006 Transcript_131529/m.196006 type:complete len:143 (-) Transcript_131529:67-495(-)|eukprot:CAMPEP_0117035042 /NCGR_PEP_ID=MMETSP0472-20121206/24914_1 /TAXON_ID=693140 ORGANISM="Tiarina fusus, Strain LIS" /NCGR_SAMPLE_ID=MMETSP0472 /ASSEMBLY_ACC=CAM_ASM_000603 /LENGTH=142 /DNA_ID=CAMNT_0004744399 /DNA_START=143 /DNA_END=571 /DNA_ORIENTATION=+